MQLIQGTFGYLQATALGDQTESDKPKPEFGSWFLIVGRADKNKENNSLPRKWAAFKVLRFF